MTRHHVILTCYALVLAFQLFLQWHLGGFSGLLRGMLIALASASITWKLLEDGE